MKHSVPSAHPRISCVGKQQPLEVTQALERFIYSHAITAPICRASKKLILTTTKRFRLRQRGLHSRVVPVAYTIAFDYHGYPIGHCHLEPFCEAPYFKILEVEDGRSRLPKHAKSP